MFIANLVVSFTQPQHGGQLHDRVSALWGLRGAAIGPTEPHSGGFLNSHRRDL